MEQMDVAVYLLPLMPVFVLFAVAYFFRRWQWTHRYRARRRNLGFFPSATALGNALQTLQSLAEPEIRHVVEKKMEEDAEDDESGDEEDIKKQLNRSLRRIRRGERVDRLKVRSRRNLP